MKSPIANVINPVIVSGFLMLSPCFSLDAEAGSTAKLDNVEKKIQSLNDELSSTRKDREALQQVLKNQSLEISTLSKSLHKLDKQIREKKTELAQLHKQTGIQEKQQKQQLDALYTQMRHAYLNAQPRYLELLLNQQDIAQISRTSTYFRYFNQARKEQIESVSNALSQLNEEQKSLLKAQQSLENLRSSQHKQQAQLQSEKDKRKLTLAALDKTISSQQARLHLLETEAEDLRSLIDSLDKKSKQHTTTTTKPSQKFSALKGKLPWPIKGKLAARYGTSRNVGTLSWQGIIIASQTGKEVKASASGKVVFADWLKGFGLLIIIDHGDQYMTLYGNNAALLKEVGDRVESGEVISQSGEQGISKKAGLYFEIRYRGTPFNPSKWLKKKG